VDDGRPTDDAILPVESDSAILEIDLCDAGTIGVHIPEIARVALVIKKISVCSGRYPRRT